MSSELVFATGRVARRQARIAAWHAMHRRRRDLDDDQPLDWLSRIRAQIEVAALPMTDVFLDVEAPACSTIYAPRRHTVATSAAKSAVLASVIYLVSMTLLNLGVPYLDLTNPANIAIALALAVAWAGTVAVSMFRRVTPIIFSVRMMQFTPRLTHYNTVLGRASHQPKGAGATFLAALHAWIDAQPGARIGGHVNNKKDNWEDLRAWYLAHGRVLDTTDRKQRRTYYPPAPHAAAAPAPRG